MGTRLGLVLGGGGVRALAHAGVLTALEEHDLAPHVLVGVSMGAVVASAYAAREDWAEALRSVDRTRLPAFTDPRDDEGLERLRSLLRSARQLAPSVWSWGREGFEEFGRRTLAELLGAHDLTFADTRTALAVVATDLHAGTRAILTDGDLATATLASAAIPGIGSPILIGEQVLIDGGFADPAPVDVARDLGADVVVAVHTGQHEQAGPPPDNWTTALLRGLEIGQRSFVTERLRHADLVIRPDFGARVNLLNFSAIDDVVATGYAATNEAIGKMAPLLTEQAGSA